MAQKMNDQMKKFCYCYVANGYKGKDAYMEAYPNCKEISALSNSWRMLQREDVKQFIKDIQHERFEQLNISADRIAEELAKMAFADFDDNNSATTKTKALELLSKQLGLYTQKIDANIEGSMDIVINIEDDEQEEE